MPQIAAPLYAATISNRVTGAVLADVSFTASPPADAGRALATGRAEMIIAFAPEPDLRRRVLAIDTLTPIVAPDNPIASISMENLTRALTGEVANWRMIDGPDMPIMLHSLPETSGLQRAILARLGTPMAASFVHADMASLANAVARDPWALAVTGRSLLGAARALDLTDPCGFPLPAQPLAFKAEDDPLLLPIYLLTPRRRLPLFGRQFLEFLATPVAQQTIAASGFIDRRVQRQAASANALRLINAVQAAGDEVTLPELKRLITGMAATDRLSLTFRFDDGSSQLDATSQENLAELARLLATNAYPDQTVVLAGFSDGSGPAAANIDLARARTENVVAALRIAAPDLADDMIPKIEAYGETLPIACDNTASGRQLNRRVETWIRPKRLTDSPAP